MVFDVISKKLSHGNSETKTKKLTNLSWVFFEAFGHGDNYAQLRLKMKGVI